MVITDPAPTQTAPTAFEVLNLYSIDGVTIPAGMSESDVSVGLTRAGSGTTKYVLGLAKLLKPADLADVIGIEVTFARTGNLPIIGAGATGELNLTWQLRSTQRTGGTCTSPTRPIGMLACERRCASSTLMPSARAVAVRPLIRRSVAVGPGLTAFTRTPWAAYATASPALASIRAALAAPPAM